MADDPQQNRIRLGWTMVAGLIAVTVLGYLLLAHPGSQQPTPAIPYTTFRQLVTDNRVASIELRGPRVSGQLVSPQRLGQAQQPGKAFTSRVPSFGNDDLMALLEAHHVSVDVKPESETGMGTILIGLLPWLLLMAFFYWAWRSASRGMGGGRLGGPGELNRFLQSPTHQAEVPKVTFEDVAGQEGAKREITELVDYLRDPDRFRRLGAEIPRGVLLMGPPGTGKTLLARALAGQADVPFYSISASEFIEVYVGVGASRVRHLFEQAKKDAPAIIFIDELDSVGRTRGTGLGGGHDEREQTLNQILAEMDGFSGHEAVIVLAATNRPDVLDPALLRPGRFDRHVTLDLPDRSERAAILAVHTRKLPLTTEVDLKTVAAGTPGFSGADLKNLANEAAINAVREGRQHIEPRDFDEARDKLLLGTVRTLAIQPEERHRLAVHESGHTVAAYFLPHADPLYKVTIIPRGRALGGTQQLPEEERHTLPEEYLRDRLAVMLGGRAAEKELLGSISSGADDDIKQASTLARAMISRWGMSEEVGPVDLRDSDEHPFLGREIAQPRRFSERSAETVDKAVRELLIEAEQKALDTLRAHLQQLDALIRRLEQQETLDRRGIEACLGAPAATPASGTTGIQ
ncbi:MAG TPA: ATP-dependent zinc metalloprotease FtsH [Gammaproteobacteria bacterium]|nr:ATP-dependent zinc metalloprotease FtsH [Gammaproteobacteria bacterium]